MKNIVYIGLLFCCFLCQGQQLSYKPINPFFGGDTFNYQMMLSSASAQNSFTDPKATKPIQKSELEQFKERLNSQLLNLISRQMFSEQFGSELKEGTFTFGNLSVEIYNSSQGMVFNILNTESGEQTQIIMPSQ